MDRCTGRHDITEILLKTALNTIQSINQLYWYITKSFSSYLVNQNFSKPFPKRQILYSSKMKEFAGNYCEFDEYGGKFSKWVENTVGKGEIARYEQFHLFPQCFLKTCTADT